MTGCPNQLWCTWAHRHTCSLSVPLNHHVPCSTAALTWRELAEMCGDVLATPLRQRLPWLLPDSRAHGCSVISDGPRRQASGFRWWVRKSSPHQECSSPAELSCILLPTQAYSIYHLHSVTVGDKTSSAQIESNQLWYRGTSKRGFSHQEKNLIA